MTESVGFIHAPGPATLFEGLRPSSKTTPCAIQTEHTIGCCWGGTPPHWHESTEVSALAHEASVAAWSCVAVRAVLLGSSGLSAGRAEPAAMGDPSRARRANVDVVVDTLSLSRVCSVSIYLSSPPPQPRLHAYTVHPRNRQRGQGCEIPSTLLTCVLWRCVWATVLVLPT